MNLKKTAYLTLLAAAAAGFAACDDFLDVDPSKSTQKTIETAEQLDALLGSYSRFYPSTTTRHSPATISASPPKSTTDRTAA